MLHGYNCESIYLIFKKYASKIKYLDFKNVFRVFGEFILKGKFNFSGLNSGDIIEKIINQECSKKNINNINQIKMPLLMTSVDLHTGKIYYFTSQLSRTELSDEIIRVNNINIGRAVRASCSYPLVFSPCKYNNTELIDGGIRENVPWKGTKEMGADKIISIVFTQEIDKNCCRNIIDVVNTSIDILTHELSNYELEGADFLLKIKAENIALLETKKIDELYKLGYETMKKNIFKIKKLIN